MALKTARKPRQRARAGEGSVFERDGKWVAMISIGGRANRRKVRRVRATESEAWEALRRLRAEYQDFDPFDEKALRLEDHLKAWLEERKPRVRTKTWVTYELVLRLHVTEADKALAAMTIDRIKPAHIGKLMATLEADGVSARVRELVYLRLRAAFERAVGKTIRTNPVLPVHKPRVERVAMKTWTPEEAKRFLEATANDWLGALYRLALSVGMRRGELLGLQWADVDLKSRRISIQHQLTESGELVVPKTPGSIRAIELPQRAVDALKLQKAKLLAAGLRASPWVFPDESGESYRTRKLTYEFDAAIATAKVPRLKFHGTRHTCATLMLSQGVSVKVVSAILGHANATVTLNTYAHVLPGAGRAAAELLDSVL